MMKTCLFCRNTRIFNIHNDYGNSSHTAKDDMLQFFGYQIESHLRPDDAICNLCMNIMDNVAKLKRRLLPLIFRSEASFIEDIKPINFGKKWDVFASMNFEEEDPFLETRSPTPSNLLKCKRVVPYESPVEMKIAELERHRSLSCVSRAKSDANSEVAEAFLPRRSRRRRRGHNWSRRKNGRYSRISTDTRKSATSTYTRRSSTRSRPISSVSDISTESYEAYNDQDVEDTQDLSPITVTSQRSRLRYDSDGCLQNKRTRSVAKQQEEEIRLLVEDEELYECPEEGCSYITEEIDMMARHKMTKHRQLALYWCNFCGQKYTSSGDLDIHKRSHCEQYSCVICHQEFYFEDDLVTHWQQHVKKSVPCKYCGKRFINKKVCNTHQKNVHRRNAPSRIDYEARSAEQSNKDSNSFEVRIMVQDVDNQVED